MGIGFDHQSHFSIFAYLYEQKGVWRQAAPESASMFLSYPPLAGALGVGLATLASPDGLATTQLVRPYIQTSSGMFGLSAGLLAWTAAEAGRTVAITRGRGDRAGVVAVVSGLAVGGYIVLGPASALFDYGFNNFFLAVAIATSASWLVISERDGFASQAAATTVAAATAMGLLWTPLVGLLLPAGLILAVRIISRRSWKTLALAVILAGVGMWVVAWQARRMIPDGPAATSFAQAIASLGGGQPAIPVPHLVILLVLGLSGLALTRTRPGVSWLAPWAVPGAGAVITLAFAANAIRLGFPVLDAYFVAKTVWIVYLSVLPLIGTMVAAAMLMVLRNLAGHDAAYGRAPQGDRTRLALVGALTLALVWLSTPTQSTSRGHFDYYTIPVGSQAVLDRRDEFRGGAEGRAVVQALEVTRNQQSRLTVIWKGRDLLTNRWLASLRGDLTVQNDVIFQALAEAPDGSAARGVLEQALAADPTLDVVIVASEATHPDSLQSLIVQFPGRVAIQHI